MRASSSLWVIGCTPTSASPSRSVTVSDGRGLVGHSSTNDHSAEFFSVGPIGGNGHNVSRARSGADPADSFPTWSSHCGAHRNVRTRVILRRRCPARTYGSLGGAGTRTREKVTTLDGSAVKVTLSLGTYSREWK